MTDGLFHTLVVASTLTGVGLGDDITIGRVRSCAAWLCGHDVWTHELVHGPTKEEYLTAGYEQFPEMPTPEEARADWRAAARKALDAYGRSVMVRQGNHARRESPAQTFFTVYAKANELPDPLLRRDRK